MARFFTSWESWKQLSFVLACSLVMVLSLAYLKKRYNIRRLSKHAAAELEKNNGRVSRRGSTRQENGTGTDEPFGSKALESGIEIPGVWISRSNTPEPNSHQSPYLPYLATPDETNVDIEKQVAALPRGMWSASSFDRAVGAERLPSSHRSQMSSRTSSIDGRGTRAPGVRHPPSSYGRHRSDEQSKIDHETYEQATNSNREARFPYITNFGEPSSSSINISKSSLTTNVPRPNPNAHSTDMYHVRLSQAAEMGQLTRFQRSEDSNLTLSRETVHGVNHRPSSGQEESPYGVSHANIVSPNPQTVSMPNTIHMPDSKPFHSFRGVPTHRGDYHALSTDDEDITNADYHPIDRGTHNHPDDIVAFPPAAPRRKRISIRQPGFPWFRASDVEFEIIEPELSKKTSETKQAEDDGVLPTTPQRTARRGRSSSKAGWRRSRKKGQTSGGSSKGSDV